MLAENKPAKEHNETMLNKEVSSAKSLNSEFSPCGIKHTWYPIDIDW